MLRRTLVPILAALALSALFIRLGFWQLSRLAERRARNAIVLARTTQPATTLETLPADTAAARFRRVRLDGTFDYAHEVAVTNRIRDGAPGVHLVTPLRTTTGALVLVDRGWVYSPNGADVDHAHWREADSVHADGYVETFPPHLAGAVRGADSMRVRWLSHDDMSRRVGAGLAPFYVMLGGDTTVHDGVPVRVPTPPLDEGPHFNYALQWFSFAAISLVGMGIWVAAEVRKGKDEGRESRVEGRG